MLTKPRASVSSGVNGRTRGLSAADAQEALEKTALVSVFPRARRCPVLTEFVIPLGRHGECVWVKEGMQESSCIRVMVRSPGDHTRWARGRGLLRAERWFERTCVPAGFSAQQCPGFRCSNLRGASEGGFEWVTAPSTPPRFENASTSMPTSAWYCAPGPLSVAPGTGAPVRIQPLMV